MSSDHNEVDVSFYELLFLQVIDYDEFLNFSRNEGCFTVFGTFIPKLVSIPAQAFPLAVISALGFRDGGAIQSNAVVSAIVAMFVVIPCLCTLISFLVKLKYPIKTPQIIEEIYLGIQEHMRGNGAEDALTGEWVEIEHLDPEQEDLKFLIDNFTRPRVNALLLERSAAGQIDGLTVSTVHVFETNARFGDSSIC